MIGVLPTLRAELTRTSGSAAAWLTLIGVPIAVIATLSGTYATPDGSGRSVFMWQALFATGMSAPLIALIAGLTSWREQRAREAGTSWRAVRPLTVLACRFTVAAGLAALLNLFVFGLTIPFSAVLGRTVDPLDMLFAAAVSWAGSLGLLACALIAADMLGAVGVFLFGCVWQVIGTLCAETPVWWLIPPTWSVRAMLPVLGIHANATPLAADDRLAGTAPWAAILLSAGLALLVTVIRPRLSSLGLRPARAHDTGPVGWRSMRPGRLPAIRAVLRGRGIGALCAAAIALSAAAAVIYHPTAVIGFYSFLLLPAGAVLLPVIAWLTLAPGWRLLLVRRPGIVTAVPTQLLIWVLAVTAIVWLIAAAGSATGPASQAMTAGELFQAGVLLILLGVACVLLSLWLAVRLGPGWALGVGIGGMVVSATFGGDVLATGWLWVLGPTGWPLTAAEPGRFLIAVLCCLAAAVTGWTGAVRALRTAPLREGRD